MRGELSQLQSAITQRNQQLQSIRANATKNSQDYHGLVAAVSTRLQMGTTPGNPILVSQWNSAQVDLDKMSADVAQRSEEHTSELQSLMRISYAVFCLKKNTTKLTKKPEED